MLVFAKAEVQQALDQALQRAAQAEQEVARLERRVRELDDTAGFDARNKARELEAENRQLRRTISSLSKASAAERETYQVAEVGAVCPCELRWGRSVRVGGERK
jgi:uncharacterized membrane protein